MTQKASSASIEDPQVRVQRMLDRKIAAMKAERRQLEILEQRIKQLAKELGVTLT